MSVLKSEREQAVESAENKTELTYYQMRVSRGCATSSHAMSRVRGGVGTAGGQVESLGEFTQRDDALKYQTRELSEIAKRIVCMWLDLF